MKIGPPPDIAYDDELKSWLHRLSVALNNATQLVGSFMQLRSNSTYPGSVSFNRDIASGAILNASHFAWAINNISTVLQIECYDTAGSLGGTLTIDQLGNLWVSNNVSALSFTDRTKFYDGDALAELGRIAGKDGEIDHDSLPEFMRKEVVTKELVDKDNPDSGYKDVIESGRDLGAAISMLIRAATQLNATMTDLQKRVEQLEKA